MNHFHPERGAAAVEFALVVLPLLLVMVAIVSLGVVFNQQLAVTAAAREGIRHYAVYHATRPTTAKSEAEVLVASMVSGPVSFSWTDCGPTSDEARVEVTTAIDAPIGGFDELIGLTDLELIGVGSMRCGG